MAQGGMLCLRNSLFIFVAGLCVVNGQQQKLFSEEEQHGYIGTDQTPSQDGSSSSKVERKTLTVWMKSPWHNNRGLTVYDSEKLIYQIDNDQHRRRTRQVSLMNAAGEVVFTIRRQAFFEHYMRYHPGFEGYRGPGSSPVSSKQGSFDMHPLPSLSFLRRVNKCKVGYDDKRYILTPCKIEDSDNAKLEFKIMTEDKTIAELKQMYVDGHEIPLLNEKLKLEIEPEADVSFVVALVAVFGLINDKI